MTRKIVFHTFRLGDVEDVATYAAWPIQEFLETDKGQWVKQYANDLMYFTENDFATMGHRVAIQGIIEDPRLITEYYLRWPEK